MLKKNLLLFTLVFLSQGFFCTPDLLAMEKKNDQELFQKESAPVIYNDLGLFKKKTWVAHNAAFGGKFNENSWKVEHKNLIVSLKKRKSKIDEIKDFDYFFHAINDTHGNVVSFLYGYFCTEVSVVDKSEKPTTTYYVYIEYLGTVPDCRGNGLAKLLLLSIFDKYLEVKKISLSAEPEVAPFYMNNHFTAVEGSYGFGYQLLRENAQNLRTEKRVNKPLI